MSDWLKEHFERARLMATDNGGTWDLSRNDKAALRVVLDEHDIQRRDRLLAESALATARASNAELHRRCQAAESKVTTKALDDMRMDMESANRVLRMCKGDLATARAEAAQLVLRLARTRYALGYADSNLTCAEDASANGHGGMWCFTRAALESTQKRCECPNCTAWRALRGAGDLLASPEARDAGEGGGCDGE
jgi:hypothetical protein